MAPKQRMRIANDKAAKNVTQRGNVPKTTSVCVAPACTLDGLACIPDSPASSPDGPASASPENNMHRNH
ncbi:Stress-associated endoplasmic reticulum protein 1-like [Homarus americanus]|uniref:Stress-associated endoplasmic reticulum protein 1-like n=1 Tax=Homarus americanus TaxID=6706 RepID=A0A8J5K538_HOMAM|nr:Stress-associated endoplasmic reticulum protein 1-like [Homarus americanus]